MKSAILVAVAVLAVAMAGELLLRPGAAGAAGIARYEAELRHSANQLATRSGRIVFYRTIDGRPGELPAKSWGPGETALMVDLWNHLLTDFAPATGLQLRIIGDPTRSLPAPAELAALDEDGDGVVVFTPRSAIPVFETLFANPAD